MKGLVGGGGGRGRGRGKERRGEGLYVGMREKEKERLPFLSSMVTVSLAHFIKNLDEEKEKSVISQEKGCFGTGNNATLLAD